MPSTPIKAVVWKALLVPLLIAIASLLFTQQPTILNLLKLKPINNTLSSTLSKMASTTATSVPAGTSAALRSRQVAKKVYAVETPEGAGALVRRSIGTPALRNLSPFLMLDQFTIAEGAGFPDHPHRGMTTVTLLLDGSVQHEDFAGHEGTLAAGDMQWMSAARGIMHAEMPVHRDAQGNKLPDPVGLQLWVDLPAAAKKAEPTYQEYKHASMPFAAPRSSEPVETEGSGWSIKVIAGESHGVSSPVRTPENGGCQYYEIKLDGPGARVFQQVPAGWTSFVYTISGAPIRVGDSPVEHAPHHTLVLDPKDEQANGVWIEHAGTKEGEVAHLVVIAGQPLDQEVHQHGPFVLTSRAEVMDTFRDYQTGQNGFERAPGWRSKIGNRR